MLDRTASNQGKGNMFQDGAYLSLDREVLRYLFENPAHTSVMRMAKEMCVCVDEKDSIGG